MNSSFDGREILGVQTGFAAFAGCLIAVTFAALVGRLAVDGLPDVNSVASPAVHSGVEVSVAIHLLYRSFSVDAPSSCRCSVLTVLFDLSLLSPR